MRYLTLLRRAIVPAFLLLSLVASAAAQSSGSVEGVVIDGAAGRPLHAATVQLRPTGDTTARPLGKLTDADGRFRIEGVPLGISHRLEVSYIGYRRHVGESIELTSATPSRALDTIRLAAGALPGASVSVTAERPAVSVLVDKTVYAVEGNPGYTATTVSELLGQIPTVEVDQDGNISLRGESNVTIMMDGRKMTMPAEQRNKLLQALPASTVRDIEIRTNPGAAFDASDRGGIINIVTRRKMSDVLGAGVNASVDSRGGLSGGATVYYDGDELAASAGGGLSTGNRKGSAHSLRINRLDSLDWSDSGSSTNESEHDSRYGNAQIDYHLGEHDLLSLSWSAYDWSSTYASLSSHRVLTQRGDLLRTYSDVDIPELERSNDGGHMNASFLFRHTFEGEHRIGLDVGYNQGIYKGQGGYLTRYLNADGTIDSSRMEGRNQISDQQDRSLISTLDYDNPLSDHLSFSLGLKQESNWVDNLRDFFRLDIPTGEFLRDTLQSSHYLPESRVWAGYGNLSLQPLTPLRLQIGLRLESSSIGARYKGGAEFVRRRYTNIFPSGSIAYTLAESHSLNLSYRRSVALPSIESLNPTVVRWNATFESVGNPDLEPEFTQQIELGYTTFWGAGNMLSISPFYATTSGSIERSQELVNGINRSTYSNFNGTWRLGGEGSLSLRPIDEITLRISGNVARQVNRGGSALGDVYSVGTSYGGSGMLNVDIVGGLSFSTTFFMRRPALVGESRTSGFNYWSAGLRQRLLDRKLTIMLRLNDPFEMQKWENTYESPTFYSWDESRWSSRYLSLSINYTIGTTPRMESHEQERTETKGGGGGGSTGGGGGGQ